MKWVCHNGEMVPAGQPLFGAANRSFRYGDGLFETAKVFENRLLLAPLHFNRLFTSLQLLQIKPSKHFTPGMLEENMLRLCEKNNCTSLARVRQAVYRQADGTAGYLVEAEALHAHAMQLNKKGWRLVVYPLARKSCDAFANVKSANFLPYVLAGTYAAEKEADEALVLNSYNNVADGSKTNLFFIKGKTFYTPALAQGCVAGVMRLHVIDSLKKEGFAIHQTAVTGEQLMQADELFCTNAVQGIRWVHTFNGKEYGNGLTQEIYNKLFPASF